MGENIGMGITVFEPETNFEKRLAAADEYKDFMGEFKKVVETMEAFGWESQECQEARNNLNEWQQQRGMVEQVDQDQYHGHPII